MRVPLHQLVSGHEHVNRTKVGPLGPKSMSKGTMLGSVYQQLLTQVMTNNCKVLPDFSRGSKPDATFSRT